MASREARIKRVERVLRNAAGSLFRPRQTAAAVVDAAGDPDMMGTAEVAELLGCSPGNLHRQRGLPEPSQRLRAGPIWNAEEIRKFKTERDRRRRNGRRAAAAEDR